MAMGKSGASAPRARCTVCGGATEPSPALSILSILKHGCTTVCEFLTKFSLVSAQDVVRCGHLCDTCIATIRRCDKMQATIASSMKKLYRKKVKASGGTFKPVVIKPHIKKVKKPPVKKPPIPVSLRQLPTTADELTLLETVDDLFGGSLDPAEFDFGGPGAVSIEEMLNVPFDAGDFGLGRDALTGDLLPNSGAGKSWFCPSCSVGFSQEEYEDRAYHRHMLSHCKPDADAPDFDAVTVNAKIYDAFFAPDTTKPVSRGPKRQRQARRQRKCPHCDHVANHSSSLSYHIRTVHTEQPAFACEECGEKFASQSARNTHRQKVHLKKALYQCDHCDKGFYSKLGYEYHLKSIAEDTEKRMCDKCGLQVPAHKLNQHIADMHKEKRVYRCPHCENVTYSHKRIIDKHLALVHNIGTVKANPSTAIKTCSECGKQIKRNEYFVAHMFEEHGIRLPSLKEFKCEPCGKFFYKRESYRRHIQAHETGPKYACGECEYTSCYSANVVSHMKRMHSVAEEPKPETQEVTHEVVFFPFVVTPVL